MKQMLLGSVVVLSLSLSVAAQSVPRFQDLFNGKDLTGWVNVNTAPDTWSVKDGLLICSGHPIGVMRSEKQYENFILHIEWMHMEPGGNSGVFVWSDASPTRRAGSERRRSADAGARVAEAEQRERRHAADRLRARRAVRRRRREDVPDNPRGERSKSIENRCKGTRRVEHLRRRRRGRVIKLAVNGKFVNGISKSTQKKGYLCLESEGAEIHFRNIRILELPPGVTAAEVPAVTGGSSPFGHACAVRSGRYTHAAGLIGRLTSAWPFRPCLGDVSLASAPTRYRSPGGDVPAV